MPRVAAAPSIIDDAGFLDELDKLEGHPEPPELDVLSAYWDHAMRTDADDQQHLPALVPESPAIAPVVRSVRSAKLPRPLRFEQPLRLETPVRAHMPARTGAPFWPQAPAQPAARVQSDSSARSEHVDEIGEGDAALTPEPTRVHAAVAALMVGLCLGVGAASAALVFHDRVAQIAVSWWK